MSIFVCDMNNYSILRAIGEFACSSITLKVVLFQISKYFCKGHELYKQSDDLHQKQAPVCVLQGRTTPWRGHSDTRRNPHQSRAAASAHTPPGGRQWKCRYHRGSSFPWGSTDLGGAPRPCSVLCILQPRFCSLAASFLEAIVTIKN